MGGGRDEERCVVERTEERRTELDVKTCGSMVVERRGVKKCVDEKKTERVLERYGKVVMVDTTVDAAEVERTLEMRTEAVGTTTKDEDRTVDAAEDERTDEKWTEGVGMTSEERAVDATEDERTREKRTADEGRVVDRAEGEEKCVTAEEEMEECEHHNIFNRYCVSSYGIRNTYNAFA